MQNQIVQYSFRPGLSDCMKLERRIAKENREIGGKLGIQSDIDMVELVSATTSGYFQCFFLSPL